MCSETSERVDNLSRQGRPLWQEARNKRRVFALWLGQTSIAIFDAHGAKTGHRTNLWQLLQQCLPARPSIFPRLLICISCTGLFAFAHEAVTSTLINHRLVFFSRRFH